MNTKFWKPGTVAPGMELERPENDLCQNVFIPNSSSLELKEQRKLLPIYRYKKDLLYLLETNRTVVVVGETGCGKTTQIPQYLHENGWTEPKRCVVCTQPRRIAATSIARRVSEEMNVTLGEKVGYSVRFDDKSNRASTRIKYVTDGILCREMMKDPLLTSYSVIMVLLSSIPHPTLNRKIDEAHERSLYTDLLLALLKQILKQRPELRLIVASATLEAEEFACFFNTNSASQKSNSCILSVEGRKFPVAIHYLLNPTPSYLHCLVETVFKINETELPGDILAFLTGQDEIEEAISLIQEKMNIEYSSTTTSLLALPMHSSLPYEFQEKVFEEMKNAKVRKVILATNIAETSITIPNIVYVIDCGFTKLKVYNAETGMESLVVTPISKASATQRSGRAGRVKEGKAYRLYTEASFSRELSLKTTPEIQRTNLAFFCLQLKALGIDNIVRFDFITPPLAESLARAMDLLFSLGAIDRNGQLTYPLGEQMVELPIDPKLSKMLLVSGKFGCSDEILIIASMLQLENVFLNHSDARKESNRKKMLFAAKEGDHLTVLNLYKAFEKYGSVNWCQRNFINRPALLKAKEIKLHLTKFLKRFEIPIKSSGNVDAILKNIVAGYFSNAARLKANGTYETIRDQQTLQIHPSSVLYNEVPPPWITFHSIILTNVEYARDISSIDSSWLLELAPHFYEPNKFVKINQ